MYHNTRKINDAIDHEIIEIIDSDDEGEPERRSKSPALTDYNVDDSLILQWEEDDTTTVQHVPANDNPVPGRDVSPESNYEGIDESIFDALAEEPFPSPSPGATTPLRRFSTISTSRSSSILPGPSTTVAGMKRMRSDASGVDVPVAKRARTAGPMNPDMPCIIAQNDTIQRLMNLYLGERRHGLRFELARLVSTGTDYGKITEQKLKTLAAHNDISSSFIDGLICNGITNPTSSLSAAERSANCPFKEIEKEEDALARDADAGVGNNPEFPGWHGGKSYYGGHVVQETSNGELQVKLDPPRLGGSSQFSRQFGSHSFIHITIPNEILHSEKNRLDTFFQKKFIVWGKTYRAVFAKEGTVYLFWTNEIYGSSAKVPGRLSFESFLEWGNPLSSNSKQLMPKWSTRIALGFSTTVPGPVILQENIYDIGDEVSVAAEGESSIMTDGCGFTSVLVHNMVVEQLSLSSRPTAVQFRLAGCKGLTVFESGLNGPDPSVSWAKLRPSQKKISFPKERALSKSHRTINIVRTSHLVTPTRLSNEVMINLHENGVRKDFFVKLLKQRAADLIDSLTKWEGPESMVHLAAEIYRIENVYSSRRARRNKGEARARGDSNFAPHEEESYNDVLDDDDLNLTAFASEKSVAWWGDSVSGCPSTLSETAVTMILSGLTPQECPVLREKIKQILRTALEREMTKLRLEVKQSCSAFAIPDPLGVLGENQIFVRSSHPSRFIGEDGLSSDILQGDVLATRNPCKVLSDTRKVQAVDIPQLYPYTDVIIFSTKGKRRLIDYLAGGDYDGDKVTIFWDKELVNGFGRSNQANERYSHEPSMVKDCFTRDTETGDEFLRRLQGKGFEKEEKRIHAYQHYLLGALRSTSMVGVYSTWHDKAIYKHGYSHRVTQEIAAKFCRILDSPKTGFRLKREVYTNDQQYFNTGDRGPAWKEAVKSLKKKVKPEIDSNLLPTKREISKEFIMDVLVKAAQAELNERYQQMDEIFPIGLCVGEDRDLAAPWLQFVSKIDRGPTSTLQSAIQKYEALKEMDATCIRTHIAEIYEEHRAELANKGAGRASKQPKFTDLHITTRQDMLRRMSREFDACILMDKLVTIQDKEVLRRLCASYVYIYDRNAHRGRSTRYPFNVAFRELCLIKAKGTGKEWLPVLNQFGDRMRFEKH